MKRTKTEHNLYKNRKSIPKFIGLTFPKRHRTYKEYSIISPSVITFNKYEATNGIEVRRFETLGEARKRCKRHFILTLKTMYAHNQYKPRANKATNEME